MDHKKCWKILKDIEIPDHLTCLLRNLYAGQEATVRTGHGTKDWLQIEKGVCQAYISSPCLFTLYSEYIKWNSGLDTGQAGMKIAGRNINNFIYADDITLISESEEELNSLLMKLKEESKKKKNLLKTQLSKNEDQGIWSHHFMTNRWKNNGNSERLHFLGLQNHSRWWLKPWNLKTLSPWKKSYDKPRQHIKKQRHYFPDKCPYNQSYGFSSSYIWMWELDYKDSWALKNDAFEVWFWRRLLRVPWTA